jgi:hypothetical protein
VKLIKVKTELVIYSLWHKGHKFAKSAIKNNNNNNISEFWCLSSSMKFVSSFLYCGIGNQQVNILAKISE